jgi:hypothetical protein
MFNILCLIGNHDWEPIIKEVVSSGELIDDLTKMYIDKHNNLPPQIKELVDIEYIINEIFNNTYRGSEFYTSMCLRCGKKGNPEAQRYINRLRNRGDKLFNVHVTAAKRQAKLQSLIKRKHRTDIENSKV